jgi:hypothetical protein
MSKKDEIDWGSIVVSIVDGFLLVTLGLLPVLAGIITFAYQCLHWLRYGTWMPISFRDALLWAIGFDTRSVEIAWVGLATLWEIFFDLPAALILIVVWPFVWAWTITPIFWLLMRDK